MVNALVINPSRPIAPTDTTPSMENVFYAMTRTAQSPEIGQSKQQIARVNASIL
jgi:hypothetical protein